MHWKIILDNFRRETEILILLINGIYKKISWKKIKNVCIAYWNEVHYLAIKEQNHKKWPTPKEEDKNSIKKINARKWKISQDIECHECDSIIMQK